MTLHVIKLVVGIESLTDFRSWQARSVTLFEGQKANMVHTRFTPKRADEILKSDGSIYRVIGGSIRCRQKLIGFEAGESAERGKYCIMMTDTEIIPTFVTPKRPFQGWRYLEAKDAPDDLPAGISEEDAGAGEMLAELKAVGLV